jgi:hypothetical protein
MSELNEDFAYCVEKFGRSAGGERIDPGVIEAYRSIVSDSMVAFWKECGVGLWLDGRFQLVRPDRYRGLLNIILRDDPDYRPDKSVLIGYGAFGQLFIWNNDKYLLNVDLVTKVAYTNLPNPRFNIMSPDVKLPMELSHIDDVIYDRRDRTTDAKPLFARAVKKCGKLGYGECYGFVPAVELGGRGCWRMFSGCGLWSILPFWRSWGRSSCGIWIPRSGRLWCCGRLGGEGERVLRWLMACIGANGYAGPIDWWGAEGRPTLRLGADNAERGHECNDVKIRQGSEGT